MPFRVWIGIPFGIYRAQVCKHTTAYSLFVCVCPSVLMLFGSPTVSRVRWLIQLCCLTEWPALSHWDRLRQKRSTTMQACHHGNLARLSRGVSLTRDTECSLCNKIPTIPVIKMLQKESGDTVTWLFASFWWRHTGYTGYTSARFFFLLNYKQAVFAFYTYNFSMSSHYWY